MNKLLRGICFIVLGTLAFWVVFICNRWGINWQGALLGVSNLIFIWLGVDDVVAFIKGRANKPKN